MPVIDIGPVCSRITLGKELFHLMKNLSLCAFALPAVRIAHFTITSSVTTLIKPSRCSLNSQCLPLPEPDPKRLPLSVGMLLPPLSLVLLAEVLPAAHHLQRYVSEAGLHI